MEETATEHQHVQHVYGFCEEFDAYYCRECNAWLEATCDDPDCECCPNRPQNHDLVQHVL